MAASLAASDTPRTQSRVGKAVVTGAAAGTAGFGLLHAFPEWCDVVFTHGAARLAASLTGAAIEPGAGNMLRLGERAFEVTHACSGTDFFLMVAVLLGWQLTRSHHALWRTVFTAVAAALPVTLLVNGLRIVAVAQAQRWLLPLLPERYQPLAHMLTGAAVFLPALIALNLVLEYHARRHRSLAR